MSCEAPQYTPTLKRATPLRLDEHTLSAERRKNRGLSSLRDSSKDVGEDERRLSTGIDYRIHPSITQLLLHLDCEPGVVPHLSAAILQQDGRVVGTVLNENCKSTCESVRHSGQDRLSDGWREGESITVDISAIALPAFYILLTVTIADEECSLDEVKDAIMQLTESDSESTVENDMWTFALGDMTGNAVLTALMTRKGAYWHFQLLRTPVTGHSLETILQNPSNLSCLWENSSWPPLFRRIHVRVVQGMDLAPKDRSRLLRKPTSDPYFVIQFKNNKYRSSHQRKTLEPHWDAESAFDLGKLLETETEGLKIEVFDHDTLKHHDFMGSVWIPASEIYEYGPGEHSFWFYLGPSRKEEFRDKKVSGKIELQFKVKDDVCSCHAN